MWLSADRLLYVGLLGAPSARTMGTVTAYVSSGGKLRLRVAGGAWQSGELAVVQPYIPHEVSADSPLIHVIQIEAETVDEASLSGSLALTGVVEDPGLVCRVRDAVDWMRGRGEGLDLASTEFDSRLLGGVLVPRRLDPRIARVIHAIRLDPAGMAAARECADSVGLSFSRFLHLFRGEVGAPFRSFRTWKRARSLLQYVNREISLAHVALDAGYPDSTHFSHSIRQVYGLRPKDIFAGSRRLAIYEPAARVA
ncbi:MAG: helix-turn-helix transcriptional regulator [Burkholderiaceae bacterium]|nr:helix-turn-helix transcriptional regulator [Burkholderiaceae bacterium]